MIMHRTNLLHRLHALSDPQYQAFHSKIANTRHTILGVRMPALRKIARELARDHTSNIPLFHQNEPIYEMVLLEGLMLSYVTMPFSELRGAVEHYLAKVDSWAQVDSVMLGFKTIPKEPEAAWDILLAWLKSDAVFVVRSGLVGLLGFYVDMPHLHKLFALAQQMEHRAYYVMMANAWMISVCMAKFPDPTLAFFANNTLDAKTHNMAIQKSIDSLRVSRPHKEILRSLRRKQ